MNQDEELRPAPAWATASGTVDVHQRSVEGVPQHPEVRILIAESIARYGWSFDERSREGLVECFTERAVWQGYIMGSDTVGPYTGREQIADFLAGFWEVQNDQRRHLFTNVITDVHGSDRATAHAYLLLTSTEAGRMTPITAGPYRFTLARSEDGTWRISHLIAGFDAPF